MVGDDQKPRVRTPDHFIQQIAEPRDIGIIQRRIDLIEHTDRRRIGQKYRKDQRQGGQRLLAPGQQRQGAEFLARRLAHDFKPGLKRIITFHHHQIGLTAAKKVLEQKAKVAVDLFKGGQQPLAAFAVKAGNTVAQGFDRLFQIILFLGQFLMLLLYLFGIFFGPKVHSAQCIALPSQPDHISFYCRRRGHFFTIDIKGLQQVLGGELQILFDPLGSGGNTIAGRFGAGL